MIERAVDREELEDIRRMILEERDLTLSEKEDLSKHLEATARDLPEWRTNISP